MRVRVLGAAIEWPGRCERDLVRRFTDHLQALAIADQLELPQPLAGIHGETARAQRVHLPGNRRAVRGKLEHIARKFDAPAPVHGGAQADRLLRGGARPPAVAQRPGRW